MKRLFLLTIGFILFISCSNDDSNPTNNSNSEIVGSWELYKIVLDDGSEINDVTDDYSTYVFNADGTGVYTINGSGANGEVQGTWDYVNSKYRFNGDELNLINNNTFWKESAINGETDYYRRVTDSDTDTTINEWNQSGEDIDGLNNFGESISLNNDGSIVAIGSRFGGVVQVFKKNGNSWTQLGNDIITNYGDENFGWSVSLNDDGYTLAIGAHKRSSIDGSGMTKVYEYNSNDWIQKGGNITQSYCFSCGSTASISADGNTVVIGLVKPTGSLYAQVYNYINNDWSQIGSTVTENSSGLDYEKSVKISGDGTKIALAIPSYGGGIGTVVVYYNNNNQWEQLGQKFYGTQYAKYLGGDVSLNYDGSVIAIGIPGGVGATTTQNIPGYVKIYENFGGNWSQIGATISGEANQDRFGVALDLNENGDYIVIGATGNDGNGNFSGHSRIFKKISNDWIQIGSDIDGESSGDSSGCSVSISSNGKTIGIGGKGNDQNGNDGHVRVYEFND